MVAAPSSTAADGVLDALSNKLLTADCSLPEKYRVLFSLRNLPGEQARKALAGGESCAMQTALSRHVSHHAPSACLPTHRAMSVLAALKDPSALLRHEVAYCLGQRQEPASIGTLTAILQDHAEHSMCASPALTLQHVVCSSGTNEFQQSSCIGMH